MGSRVPIFSDAADALEQLINPTPTGVERVATASDLFKRVKPPPESDVAAPSIEAAEVDAQKKIREEIRQRRASRTLFTGGAGVLDMAPTASQTLLGN